MIVMYWNAQRHNWQLQENQTGISTDNCSNVRIKSSAWNHDHHPPSHKLKDCSVWSILQEKVYKICITDIDDLKHRIRTEWAKLDHAVIAAAVRHWCRRLSACVKAGSGHFEHCFEFWHLNSCRLIFRSDFLAVDSYDVVRFNTWRSFNSQGKVVTTIRCGRLL